MANQLTVTVRASLCLMLVVLTGCNGGWSNWRNKSSAQQAQSELKDPARLHLTYAQLSEKTGDIQKARHSYNNALEQDAGSVEAILGLARLDLLGDRPHEAERGFLKALQIAPKDSRVAEATGQFYMSQDRFKEATKHLLTGIDLNPRDKRLRHRLGLALARQGQIAAAEPHFIQAVGAAEADYNIGLILYEQGDIDSAEQRFFQASLKKPQLAQAQHWLDTVRQERANKKNVAARPGQLAQNQLAQNQLAQAPAGNGLPNNGQTQNGSLQNTQPLGAPNSLINQQAISAPNPMLAQVNQSPISQAAPHTQHGSPHTQNVSMNGNAQASHLQTNGLQTNGANPLIQPLNPASMSATQLEQLENSMTPAERMQFRQRLQNR
jgi:Tfp pilus assembly protein PilF